MSKIFVKTYNLEYIHRLSITDCVALKSDKMDIPTFKRISPLHLSQLLVQNFDFCNFKAFTDFHLFYFYNIKTGFYNIKTGFYQRLTQNGVKVRILNRGK